MTHSKVVSEHIKKRGKIQQDIEEVELWEGRRDWTCFIHPPE
jgi:hypothetical protein